jgi:hypothetical protein
MNYDDDCCYVRTMMCVCCTVAESMKKCFQKRAKQEMVSTIIVAISYGIRHLRGGFFESGPHYTNNNLYHGV